MIIAVPKEIKVQEYRVSVTPAGVQQLREHGHRVLVEKGAGQSAGYSDQAYLDAGAEVLASAAEVWAGGDIVVKVKEPLLHEVDLMPEQQILFTFLHLAAEPDLAEALLAKGISGIAYETIQKANGSLPLLKPMSEVAGRMATQIGAVCLERQHGGKGMLLGGVPGVRSGRVCILGGGYVGLNAAKIALGFGAQVTIIDIDPLRLAYIDDLFHGRVRTLFSHQANLDLGVGEADLLIGAVLMPGARAPQLVTRKMVASMEPGSVIIDVAVDQGGSVATIRPTDHESPTYVTEGVVHYGVKNIPGNVPKTSTEALTNATIPYLLMLADRGLEGALAKSRELAQGLNTYRGQVTNWPVAQALAKDYQPYMARRHA